MKEMKVLMLVNIFCVSAMMAFLAVVGPIIRSLNMEEWHAGLTVTIGGILWTLLSRYWGKKSDMVGRKPILMIGVAGVAVSYLILAVFVDIAVASPPLVIISLAVLLLARGSIGAFYAAITPVSNALIADHVKEENRTAYISKLAATSGIAMVVGPILGGMLASYGLSVPLYVFSVLPFLGAIILFYFLPKDQVIRKEEVKVPKLFDKRLRLPMFAAFITMVTVVTSQVCLGFLVIDKLGLTLLDAAKVTGFILSGVGIGFILPQIIVSKTKLNPYFLLQSGALIAMVGYSIVSFSDSQLSLTIGFSIGAFGMGMIFPAFQALAVNLVAKEEQGAAAGTVSAAQGMGMVAGPLISTMLYKISPETPFIFTVLFFGILAVIAFKYKKIEANEKFVLNK